MNVSQQKPTHIVIMHAIHVRCLPHGCSKGHFIAHKLTTVRNDKTLIKIKSNNDRFVCITSTIYIVVTY